MNDAKRAIAEKILIALYEAWADHSIVSLAPIREASGLEDGVFHAVVEQLQKRLGLIKEYGSSYTYEITPAGVLYAEDNGLVAVEIAESHRQVRNAILSSLVDLYQGKGSFAELSIKDLAGAAGVDPLEIYHDLSLLNDIGYIRDTSSNTYQITEQGLNFFQDGDHLDLL